MAVLSNISVHCRPIKSLSDSADCLVSTKVPCNWNRVSQFPHNLMVLFGQQQLLYHLSWWVFLPPQIIPQPILLYHLVWYCLGNSSCSTTCPGGFSSSTNYTTTHLALPLGLVLTSSDPESTDLPLETCVAPP